jgi:hypothetical protein
VTRVPTIVAIDDVDVACLPVGALIPRRAPISVATLRQRLRSWEQLDRDYELAPIDAEAREAMRAWLRTEHPEPDLFRDHVFVDARGVVLVLDEAEWRALFE